MKKILLIEDDLITHSIVKHSLEPDFEVIGCVSLAEAKKWIDSETRFLAFIIDRFLPDGDGISLCSYIQQNRFREGVPILYLSGAQTETDKVGAFYAGADDYITKPFSPLELKARVQARLRKLTNNKLSIGPLEVDLSAHRAYLHDSSGQIDELNLTRIEYMLLVLFAKSLDQVFSREKLLSKVWGGTTHVSDRVIDSHVSHLRKKLSVCCTEIQLESLRGEGYRMSFLPHKSKLHAA